MSKLPMKSATAFLVLVLLLSVTTMAHSQDSPSLRDRAAKEASYERGLVILALELPNKLRVSGREFRTKPNPKGAGIFVYDPRTRFNGVERYLIWLVVNDEAYALNGASKKLTPSLKWPREAAPEVWKATGLDPYSASEAIKIVFGSE